MAVFGGVPDGFYIKSRPNRYEAEDAAYPTGGNKGTVLARYPKEYPINDQQRVIKHLAKACNIESGISKEDLQNAMRDCVPDKYEEMKKEYNPE